MLFAQYVQWEASPNALYYNVNLTDDLGIHVVAVKDTYMELLRMPPNKGQTWSWSVSPVFSTSQPAVWSTARYIDRRA